METGTITRATCPLDCPDACGVEVHAAPDGRFERLRGNREHPYSRGHLCGKTALYGELVTSPERLLAPLVRRAGRLEPATWDEAVGLVAERVRSLPGESILALSYAGSMGLVARKFPLRMMNALGATTTDGGLCDNTATAGWELVMGRVVGADLDDVEPSDLVVLWGCDMLRTHQHLLPKVKRLAGAGVPVVAIDIYRTDTIRRIESWGGTGLVVKPGTDAALALALCRLAYERGHVDRAFLASQCAGADEFEEHVRARASVDEAAAITGLSSGVIARFEEALARAQRPFVKTGVGWTRRRNGGMSMRAVCSLAAILGRADRIHFESVDAFRFDADFLEMPELRPNGADQPPIRHVELGRELEAGRFRAVFNWGHNAAVTCPDSARVRAGLERPDVFVVCHEHFLTETAARADVVLPATMFVEHADVYKSYGHRYLQLARRATTPPPGPKSNVECFAALARALDLPRPTWDAMPEELAEELVRRSPLGLSADELAGVLAGRPTKVRPIDPLEHGFGTPSGRIELASDAAEASGQPRCATYVPDDGAGGRGAFQLICAPSVHTHNSTYQHSARHQKRVGAPRVLVHPDDARELGVEAGTLVTLQNEQGRVSYPVELSTDHARGHVRIDGVPREDQAPEGIGVNALAPTAVSDVGDGNVLYSTRVDVHGA